MSALERYDVQGFVVSGYGKMREARYLLLGVRNPRQARRWIGELAGQVTASERAEERRCVNVAFTREGLAALGLDQAELSTFPPPFQEGMTAEHRQRILGDTCASHPENWLWGRPVKPGEKEPPSQVHVLLLLFARDEDTMAEVEAEHTRGLAEGGGLEVIRSLKPEPLPGRQSVGKFGIEHFGFADGMSQPVVKGSGQEDKLGGDDARRTVIEAGEFVLGYPNGYGKLTPWPRLTVPGRADENFGRNGTYLVVRHLAQDVAAFCQFLHNCTKGPNGESNPEEAERLAAKLVGRWRSGAPLVRSHHRDDPDLGSDNSFGFAAVDPYGQGCPLGAHIRRSNPRDSLGPDPQEALKLANRHRLIRRGRVYGPELKNPLDGDDGHERGLLFMCINANIERQFEFVQHTWCNNPKFAGLYDEQDPLLANQPEGRGIFTIQDSPIRKRVGGLSSFVTVRGGAYFFLPGIGALRRLAALEA
ncbi:MAG TPA: Dyp-type peroxidase [Acidimicrobiales bacterium]|nr:Dyp-type peroxidase [Acidimicrobiales bacterium]